MKVEIGRSSVKVHKGALRKFETKQVIENHHRHTGKTLGQAYSLIGACLCNPGVAVAINDHHEGRVADGNLARTVSRIIDENDLEYFEIRDNVFGGKELVCNSMIELETVTYAEVGQ